MFLKISNFLIARNRLFYSISKRFRRHKAVSLLLSVYFSLYYNGKSFYSTVTTFTYHNQFFKSLSIAILRNGKGYLTLTPLPFKISPMAVISQYLGGVKILPPGDIKPNQSLSASYFLQLAVF